MVLHHLHPLPGFVDGLQRLKVSRVGTPNSSKPNFRTKQLDYLSVNWMVLGFQILILQGSSLNINESGVTWMTPPSAACKTTSWKHRTVDTSEQDLSHASGSGRSYDILNYPEGHY